MPALQFPGQMRPGQSPNAALAASQKGCAGCPLLAVCNKKKDRAEKEQGWQELNGAASIAQQGGSIESASPIEMPSVQAGLVALQKMKIELGKKELAAASQDASILGGVTFSYYLAAAEQGKKERAKLKEQSTLRADEKRRLEALEEEINRKRAQLDALRDMRNLQNALSDLDCPAAVHFFLLLLVVVAWLPPLRPKPSVST